MANISILSPVAFAAAIPVRRTLLCFPPVQASDRRLSDLLGCIRKNNPNSFSLYVDKIVGRVAYFHGAVILAVQELPSPDTVLKETL